MEILRKWRRKQSQWPHKLKLQPLISQDKSLLMIIIKSHNLSLYLRREEITKQKNLINTKKLKNNKIYLWFVLNTLSLPFYSFLHWILSWTLSSVRLSQGEILSFSLMLLLGRFHLEESKLNCLMTSYLGLQRTSDNFALVKWSNICYSTYE